MSRIGFCGALLLLAIPVDTRGQDRPFATAPCLRASDISIATGGIAVSALGTAGQKQGATRARRWFVDRTMDPGVLWNDSQTPAHIFSSYQLTRLGAEALGRCATTHGAAWRGATYAAAIGVAKEITDGFYDGFSVGDLMADGAGISLAMLQAYVPRADAITMTLSLTGLRPVATTHGQRLGARGHAIWLSTSPHALLPSSVASAWPAPLRISVGRLAPATLHDAPSYALGLDVDGGALLPRDGRWRRVAATVRTIHLPSPAVIVGAGQRPRVALVW